VTPENQQGGPADAGAGAAPAQPAEAPPSVVAPVPAPAPAGAETAAAAAPATPLTQAPQVPPGRSDAMEGPPDEAQAAAPAVPQGPTETDKPTVIVRFGAMNTLGRFICTFSPWRSGQRIVIKSDRGQEIGTLLCAWGGCGAPCGVPPQIRGEVLRAVTHADEVEERHLRESQGREFAFSKECVAKRGLSMKMVAVEHLFGGDRIIFYFVSETRVDFRALVRDLAHEFQTRIEMRQIGVRDEARLLGDFERCGRPLCCRAWIKELEPVSMKMAKVQKATLDPAKISGRCGRLMCCLRFEHTTYRDLARNLPRKNAMVMTAEGPGKVIDTDIVAQMVGVLLANGTRTNVTAESLLPREPGSDLPREVPVDAEDAGGESAPIEMVADRPGEGQQRRLRPEPPPPQAEAAAPAAQAPANRPAGPQQPDARQQGGQGQGGQGQGGQGQGGHRRGRRRSRRGGRNRGRSGGGPGQAGGAPQGQGGPPAPSAPPSQGAAPPAGRDAPSSNPPQGN
jgi:cell fate regulator YaaT (PSP1 superfamily)